MNGKCETCGNDYREAFQVIIRGETHTFDCFECAIHKLAPRCAHCGCRVIGHGEEADGQIYCCLHCVRHATENGEPPPPPPSPREAGRPVAGVLQPVL